jgi:hypothetical protein
MAERTESKMKSPRQLGSSRRLGLTVVIALLALLAGLGTAAAKWSVFQTGNLTLKADGKALPSTLPSREFAPVFFNASGEIATVDGAHPPATREAVLYIDRNVEADTYGLPVCKKGQLEARTVAEVRRICGEATVGSGLGTAEIAFPEQTPFPVESPLTLFYGGTKGNLTTLFIHAYITVPTPTAIVTTIKFHANTHEGRYETRADIDVPKIAGGSGSLTGFHFKIGRRYTYRGFDKSFVMGRCPDGHLQVKGAATFKDEVGGDADQTISFQLSLPCTPKR